MAGTLVVKTAFPLREISIPIRAETEEIVGAVLERLFGAPPSFYINEETRETRAIIYLQKSRSTPAELRKQVGSALDELEAAGFPSRNGPVRVRQVRPQDWANSWKRHFKPFEIGGVLLVKPSWSRRRTKQGQASVVLDPGLSFGTGRHATTRFCLDQLASFRIPGARQSFLDIGTGSGILAIAAAKLGYKPVRAFDFDKEAVRVARENSDSNGVLHCVKPVRQDLAKLALTPARSFDMVCANLTYDLLLDQVARITSRVAPAGRLVLAGILVQQFEAVLRGYKKAGFSLVQDQIESEWRSGIFRRSESKKKH